MPCLANPRRAWRRVRAIARLKQPGLHHVQGSVFKLEIKVNNFSQHLSLHPQREPDNGPLYSKCFAKLSTEDFHFNILIVSQVSA